MIHPPQPPDNSSLTLLDHAARPFPCCRVGNLLGAGQPQQARLSGGLCVVSSVVFMALAAIVIFACRNVIGYIFSSDPEVISTVALIAPYAALFQVREGGRLLGPCHPVHAMIHQVRQIV